MILTLQLIITTYLSNFLGFKYYYRTDQLASCILVYSMSITPIILNNYLNVYINVLANTLTFILLSLFIINSYSSLLDLLIDLCDFDLI